MENIAYFFILGIFCIINTPVSGQILGDDRSICLEKGVDPSETYECILRSPEILTEDGTVDLLLLRRIYEEGETNENISRFIDHIQVRVENRSFRSVEDLVRALVVAWTEYPRLPLLSL
uniref:ECU07_1660 protein n=1 Tax=Fopius arisanus TaxID=64838 RepID=A0A0C9RZC3_9HYME